MRNRSNDSNYHWDYQDYRGNYGQSPARARKSSGLKYFLIAMGVVILLVGALCVGASVWGSKPAPQPDQNSSIGNELEHLPEIDQQNKPEDNVPDTTEDGLLTPAGIYKKCAPSVVGIITYGSSATAQGILANWDAYREKFVKVYPHEYKRALTEMAAQQQKEAA